MTSMTAVRRPESRPRAYADVNSEKPPSYWDYEKHAIEWGCEERYELVQKLGSNKYSEVFEAIDVTKNTNVTMKVFKLVRKKKIQREIKILQNLAGGPNIIQLFDNVRDPITHTPAIVFEPFTGTELKRIHHVLSDFDVRFYMFELLKALDYCHSMGIMHRKVGPSNILINSAQRTLRLIDWESAEFYHPGHEYNVRIALHNSKAPELLLDFQKYDYSLDMWCFGNVLAGIVFQRVPFFYGLNNLHQLLNISKVLGTDELHGYLAKYNLKLDGYFAAHLGRHPRKGWEHFVHDENQHRTSREVFDLLDKLLQYDHEERYLPREAMQHCYFSQLKKDVMLVTVSDTLSHKERPIGTSS